MGNNPSEVVNLTRGRPEILGASPTEDKLSPSEEPEGKASPVRAKGLEQKSSTIGGDIQVEPASDRATRARKTPPHHGPEGRHRRGGHGSNQCQKRIKRHGWNTEATQADSTETRDRIVEVVERGPGTKRTEGRRKGAPEEKERVKQDFPK